MGSGQNPIICFQGEAMRQIIYKDRFTGEKYIGYKVNPNNRFICVSFRDGFWYIYNVINGEPYLPIQFQTKETALKLGEFLHLWYGDYFDMLEMKDWMGVDLPSLFQYTIPNGIRINQILKQMENQVIHEVSQIFSGLV